MSTGRDDLSTRDLVHDDRDTRRDPQVDTLPAPPESAPRDETLPSAPHAETERLFGEEDSRTYLGRWESVQATFVDDPRAAVEHADGLVAEVIRRLAETFSEERENLEGQWAGGGDVSTEDLRVALQRYRAFFRRLLEV